MKLKEGFVMRDVCGEQVLVGEGVSTVDFNRLVKFNGTAAFLWKKAGEIGDFTAEQLAAKLSEEYNIDNATALADTERLLASWQKEGLLC